MWFFCIFMEFCNHHHDPISEYLLSSKDPSCLCVITPLSCLWPKGNINLLSLFLDLTFLDISDKWNHTIGGLLHLASCKMFLKLICIRIRTLRFIPSSCQIVFFYIDIHILFIHLSVDGHLGCFHFGDISNAASNIHIQFFVWMCVFIQGGF